MRPQQPQHTLFFSGDDPAAFFADCFHGPGRSELPAPVSLEVSDSTTTSARFSTLRDRVRITYGLQEDYSFESSVVDCWIGGLLDG